MKRYFPFTLLALFLFVASYSADAQTQPALETRPRTVTPVPQSQPVPDAAKQADLDRMASPSEVKPGASTAPLAPLASPAADKRNPQVPTSLTPSGIQTRIGEAERLMKSRPVPTALKSPSIEFVTVAALDRATSLIHLVTLTKQSFLTRGAELNLMTSQGTPVVLRVLRANGVNTAITLTDNSGTALAPLVVEFPIERGGVFREMAYYTSAHPALLSGDVVRSGRAYVRSMLDLAAKRLREKGVFISPQIVDVAERLCIVEHVDHERFKNENRLALYDEIYSLYALNELDTYRYSVSTAGAGGMVQMIPWAYNLIRQRHTVATLTPDFVTGMRNHANALQAMLLYMQDTWNDLTASDDIKAALDSKTATPAELLAAGYNSNAAKLPLYLRRGGDSWRTLIPRETQMYLQIYKSFESLVPLKPSAAEPVSSNVR
jgi:hypothetical protein